MKRPLRFVIICLAVVVALVMIVLAMLGTGPGLRMTASIINSFASSADTKIEISGLGGVLSGTSTVDSVSISDADGTWLTVRDVETDLSRWSLLTGKISASRLSVGMVDVLRKPAAGETSTQSGGFGLPQVQARVDNIFVRTIALEEPVLGEAAKLQLTGSVLLDADPVDLSGALELVRIDGKSGEITSNWKVSPESNELQLDLAVREPADGLLARMIDIYGLPAVDITLAGAGPLDNWQATLAVNLDGRKTVDGAVSLSITDEKQVVRGTLSGQLAPLVPPVATPFVAGNTQIELSAERDGKNTYRIETFSARSALVSITASGHVLADTDEVDLEADLTFGAADSEIALDLSSDTTLSVGYTQISTSLKGTLEKADWALNGTMKSFSDGSRSVSDARLSGRSSSIDFLSGSGPAELSMQLASISTGNESLDSLLAGSVNADVSAEISAGVLTIDKSVLSSQQLNAEVTGQYDLVQNEFDLRFASTVNALGTAPWNGVFGQQPAQIAGRLGREDDGVLILSDVTVESGNLQASAKGRVAPDALQIDGELSLARLASLNEGLSGGLEATIALSGTPDAPQFDIRAEGDGITILEKPLEGLTVEANGVAGSTGPSANLKLNGRYENQPISVAADVMAGPNGAPVIETLDLVVPGASANGRLQANASGILVGSLDLNVSSLADLGPLLLQEGLSGALQGTVEFSEQNAVQSVRAELNSQTLDLGAVQLSGTDIVAQIIDPQNDLSIDTTVNTAAVSVSGTAIRNVTSRVTGGLQALRFSVDGTLENDPLSVVGEVSSQHGTTSVELTRVSGRISSIPVELTEPATITLVDSATRIETVTLRVGQGRVTVSGAAGDQLSIDVNVQGFPLGSLEDVAPAGLGQAGTINANARITGSPSDPNVVYDLSVVNFSVAATREARIPSIGIDSSGTFASNQLKMNAKATGGGMSLTAGGSVNISNGPSLDLTLNGSAPFEFAGIPLSESGILLEGQVDVFLTVQGTAQAPRIKGSLSTSNATLIEENSALTIRDIAAQVDFDGTRANISSFNGRIGSKGKLVVAGYVDVDPASGLPADLTITVSDGTYSNGEILTTQFDADMSISGALMRAGAIGGTVTLQRTDIAIPEQLPASIPQVNVKHLHASAAVAEQARELAPRGDDGGGGQSGGALQLDLTVSAPSRIFVRGRGIDAEFGGSIQVTGSTTSPRAKGRFDLIRGRLDILTRRFDFDLGSIVFDGPMIPRLNFRTTTTVSGASYSIVIGGTASAPEISFTSVPTVPQDEILAKLFFGKDLSKLSPLQIAQLANAVSQLSGVNSGEGLLGRLRSLGGFADVDIIPDEAGGGAALGIGSYLNDRTYINVEKGLSGSSGKVTIDVDLTGNLKARGEASSDGETKAGIFYEKDY
ncbi:MAG: translocation/assembly module TamB domain-containing protein [Alphaproteobacteria bacterium]|nr:translocation/assembly module TamB domain-containing protein [Alphaproteobacteria bacterium]